MTREQLLVTLAERLDLGLEPAGYWQRIDKFDRDAARLADDHYSRRTRGSPQFMPPGQTLVLMGRDRLAIFGWWRPDPSSGIVAMNGLDGWTCSIFRNVGPRLSSELILEAESYLVRTGWGCGPDGLLTYVWDAKVRSANPGYCFLMAGWERAGRSADGRKTLLRKPFERAGLKAHEREATYDDDTEMASWWNEATR